MDIRRVTSNQSPAIETSKKPRRFLNFPKGFPLGSKSPLGLLEPKKLFKTKKRKLIFSLLLVLIILLPLSFYLWNKQAGASWWNSDWNYRKSITINSAQIPADLTNYPMLVSFTDSNLINKTQSNGNDIIFIEENGNRLDHEIEKFDNTTGELVAWVKIPQLDGDNDSIIYMYYGNQTVDNQQRPEDVWDDGFAMVQHLKEDPTGGATPDGNPEAFDSTDNNNNGNTNGSMTSADFYNGKIGKSYNFDGSDDYVRIADSSSLKPSTAISISAWVNVDATADWGKIISKDYYGTGSWSSPYVTYALSSSYSSDGRPYLDVTVGGQNYKQIATSSLNPGTWYYVVGTWDGSNMRIYINGQAENGTTALSGQIGSYPATSDIAIGSRSPYTSGEMQDGKIDEVRISNSARSANWITTEYNNQNSPSTFISLGQEEQGPSPALYLPFDEGFGTTAHDESSNRNDGNVVGATWKDESMCKNGKCLEFDGTGDYVEINDNKSLDLSEELTLEAWVKPQSTTPNNQTIISKVETPADPTKIYRSVGPSATTAIAVGTSNSMNITGDRATFATALPDNIGVGDAIQYDDDDDSDIDANDSIVFIKERVTSYEFLVATASGGVPTPINADNNWSLFRAYTSINDAESGNENTGIDVDVRSFDNWIGGKDIVASNEQWNIVCYANGATADTSLVFVNEWTTSKNNYIRIYTPYEKREVGTSQRHNGKWDTSFFVSNVNSGYNVYLSEQNVVIDGIQFRNSYNSGHSAVIYISGAAGELENIQISNCIISGLSTHSDGNNHNGIGYIGNDPAVGSKIYIYNNIIYNFSGSSLSGVGISTGMSNRTYYIYNNTIYGIDDFGIQNVNAGPLVSKNNIVQNATTGLSGNFDSSSANNLTNTTPSASNAFGITYATGTTNGTTASKLINSGETFITKGVQIGSIIKNTTDNTYTYVTALDSETQLSIANDIFISGENYSIYKNKYGTASFISTTAGSEDFHLSPTDTAAKNSGADLSQDSVFPIATDIDGQQRLYLPNGGPNSDDTKWDIGADEARATQIYRSVSPNKTDALETGEENSLTIQGFTATFQRALADNVGVGDVIQYDDDGDSDIDANDSLVFISGRVTSYEFLVTTASGGTPVPVNSDTSWSLFRAYTSLANAENGDENTGIDSDLRNFDSWTGGKDLVTSKEQWNIACYANGTTADTTAVTVDGWTTGVQNFVKIYTPVSENEVGASQRHSGKWDDGKYKLETGTGAQSISVEEDYTVIDGVQITNSGITSADNCIDISLWRSSIKISNNIIKDGFEGIASASANSSTGGHYIYNNIVYNSYYCGIDFMGSESRIISYIYNNVTYETNQGLNEWGKGINVNYNNDIIKNNISFNNNYVGSYTKDINGGVQSYNITSDFSATGTGSLINQTLNDIDFVSTTSGSEDLHILGTSVARNAGVNLSNDPYLPFETDIDGDKRLDLQEGGTTSWDIGADEAVATKIYRSVGPSNTTALATDESHDNSVVVSSGIANFSANIPDKVGVGDAVIIDTGGTANAIDASDTLLFIQKRISSTTYQLQTHTGSIPTNITSNDTYQIYRAYTSLANAESGTKNTSIPITFNGGDRNLVTNNEEWNIACYGDAVDTTAVTVDGWITGVQNFIKIYTPFNASEAGSTQRHVGKWDKSKYNLVTTATGNYMDSFRSMDDYIKIDGLQIKNFISSYAAKVIAVHNISLNNRIEISNNILTTDMTGNCTGIGSYDVTNPIIYAWNNIIYDTSNTGINVDGKYYYLYNNVVYNALQGIADTNTKAILKNNAVFNSRTANNDYINLFLSGTNNVSSDGTANLYNLTNGLVNLIATNEFIDVTNRDFRLKTNSTLKRAGLNLSNDINLPITHDIEGEKRLSLKSPQGLASGELAAFDVGADQISNTTHNNYSLNLKTNYPQTNFSTSNNDQENFSSGDINLEPNTWSHLVYKRSNNTEELYLNGSKKDSGTISNFLKTNNGKLYLGAENPNSKNSFKGLLDEVRIYPYARTEAEVKKDTTQGSSGRAASRALEGVSTSIGDTASTLSDGLVGYWKMDETSWNGTANEVKDASGNNNHGARGGDAITGAGEFGNGGDFDGSGDYVNVGSGEKIDDMSAFTWSFWAKAEGNPGNELGPVIDKSSGSTERKHIRFKTTTAGSDERKVSAKVATDGTNASVDSNTLEYTLNSWEHWTMTYDDNGDRKIHIYKNGQEISYLSQIAATGNVLSDASYDMFIGGNPPSAFYAFNGKLDEIRTYNRALSPDEIQQLYNYAPGPVLHLKMDEKSGTTAFDSSGNNNHGTLTNGPIWEKGRINGGLGFDGSDDYVNLSSAGTDYNFSVGTPFSAFAWVKPADNIRGQAIINIGTQSLRGWYFYKDIYTNNRLMVTATGGNGNARYGNTQLVAGNWYYVGFVYDGSATKIYLNGKDDTGPQGSGDFIPLGEAATASIADDIGFSYTSRWNGQIDDVKIYNYARTQEQILEDMGASAPASASQGAGALGHPILDLNFNEGQGATAHDSSGNGNNGTLVSGATGANTTTTAMWDKGGKYGGAMEFDGVNDYIYIDKNIFDGLSGYSISMWIKRDSGGSGYIFAGSSGFPYMNDFGSANGIRFKSSGADTNYETTQISDLSWHLITVVQNGSGATWYVDGEQNKALATSSLATYNNGIYIGSDSILSSFWKGKLDELKIYSYALSEDEIKTLYNGSSAMAMGSDESRNNNGTEVTGANKDYCVPGDNAKCDKPVLELKMDEKTGTTAYDSSGNGYNTTLNSATWANGKVNGGVNFPASTGTALVQNSSDLTDNWGALTIGAWVKTDVPTLTGGALYISKERSGFGGWSLIKDRNNATGRFEFEFDSQSSATFTISSTNIWPTDLNWHYVSVTYDGSYLRMYGDGQQIATPLAATGTFKDLTHQVCLGGSWSGSACGNGDTIGKSIDEVKIYNYARTPAQIAWDYNQGQPINQWTFDEGIGTTVHDEGPNLNNGTITGATWKNESECKSGKCLSFDGVNDYVQVSSSPIIGTAPFSMSTWVKAGTHSSYGLALIMGNAASGQSAWLGWVQGATIGSSNSIGGGFYSKNYGSGINDNNWHHLMLTFSGGSSGTAILYVDGIQKVTDTYTPNLQSTAIYMGKANTGTAYQYNGLVDDSKIFNYAMTAEQVKTEYNGGAVNFR